MGRVFLFGIALACVVILVYPTLAKENTAKDPAVAEDLGKAGIQKITTGVEEKLRDVASKHNVANDALNVVLGFFKWDIFGLTVGQILLSLTILFFALLFRNILSNAILGRLVQFARRSGWIDYRLVLALTQPLAFFCFLEGSTCLLRSCRSGARSRVFWQMCSAA